MIEHPNTFDIIISPLHRNVLETLPNSSVLSKSSNNHNGLTFEVSDITKRSQISTLHVQTCRLQTVPQCCRSHGCLFDTVIILQHQCIQNVLSGFLISLVKDSESFRVFDICKRNLTRRLMQEIPRLKLHLLNY